MTILVPSPSGEYVPHEGKAEVTAKAATGVGVGFVSTAPMLRDRDRTPQAIMARAQMAYHLNPWVGTAESVVTRKVVGLPWHLEDGKDEEYQQDAGDKGVPEPSEVAAARLLIERPQYVLPDPKQYQSTNSKRLMWSLTSRHIGLCGMSHWYGEGMDIRGVPTAWLYVNPARMWSETDERGNLTGWMLDASGTNGKGQPYGGLHFDLWEILTFYLDPPDHGHYGTGIYERAFLKSQLSGLADQHAAYVLGTGGRIAGIMSPKEGSIPDEKFKTIQNELRNVNEAPDAAKRTTIMQGPMDFTPTAADPSKLTLVELSKMNREDIFTIWGVPASQAPVQMSVGLNGGATKGFDEAVLMQGAVHDRVIAIKETLQLGWLDNYKPLVIELEVEEPSYDDDTPAYDLLTKSISAPLTNAERRDLIGLPPTGDPSIDNAILLPAMQTVWATAPGDGVAAGDVGIEANLNPPPAPVIMASPPASPTPGTDVRGVAGGKASAQREFLGLRKSVDQRIVPSVRTSLTGALKEQRASIAAAVRAKGDRIPAHLAARKRDDSMWWNESKEDERLAKVLRPVAAGITQTVTARAKEVLDRPAKAGFEQTVENEILTNLGLRIKGINKHTRDTIAELIAQGFADGLSPAQVADEIEASTLFNELRAETIARTETMFAYNAAALGSYREFGVDRVEALDGDQDEVCAQRDGQSYSIDEASTIEDHPNGTLDWAPYFGKSSTPVVTAARSVAPADPPPAGATPLDIAAIIREMATAMKAEPMAVHVVNGEVRQVRTVLDRDVDTGRVIGSHEEYVTQ